MKYLLMLPLFGLLFACSIDTETEALQANYNTVKSLTAIPVSFECFDEFTAYAMLDTSGGLTNGILNFVANVPQNTGKGIYKVKVEIEELADCEDLESGSNNVLIYAGTVSFKNVSINTPKVTGVKPAELFDCYKWRMIIEGVGPTGKLLCTSASPWYEAPLF